MTTTQSEYVENGSRRWRWIALMTVGLLGASFLLGFLPQRGRANRLAAELTSLRQDQQKLLWQQQQSRMRDHMNRAYLEITRNNYGVASQHATEAFNNIRVLIDKATDPSDKAALQKIDGHRDEIIAALATADASVKEKVAGILDEIYRYSTL